MLISSLLRLARFDSPIGIVLLLFPCWWGLALESGFAINLELMGLFMIGAAVMRGAGCIVNDIFDRDIDRQVERTKNRPLASKGVSVKEALLFLFCLLIIGFMVLMQLPQRCWPLAFLAVLLATVYPLAKRFTCCPQLILGLTFNMGLPIAAAAVSLNWMSWPILVAYLAAVLWTLAYDTIYALQDRNDDRRIGIGSSALLFGEHIKTIVALLYASLHILFVIVFYIMSGINIINMSFLVMSLFFILYNLYYLNTDDSNACRQFFVANQWVGLLIFAACLCKPGIL